MNKILGIGLMSGTSLDGIDAALVEIEGLNENMSVKIIDSYQRQYTKQERERILKLCSPATANLDQICTMNMYLGKIFGYTVNELLKQSGYSNDEVSFISSHGQTIYHSPNKSKDNMDVPGTLQIGDLSMLSEITGIVAVGDFRTADMAVNGQGAPLTSFADYILFQSKHSSRAVQNIGGIGNVTYIQKNATRDDVLSFDTGPGNMIIDEVVYRFSEGEKTYDKDGEIALKGRINKELLDILMSDGYFSIAPPKTTGRELFGEQYVDKIMKEYGHLPGEDIVATVTDFTAQSIAISYKNYLEIDGNSVDEVIIGGGGSYNPYLIDRIKYHLPEMDIYTHEDYNLSSDLKEAMVFAILGYQCILGEYNTIPSATGADKPVIMGKIACTQFETFKRLDALRRMSR